MVDTFEGALFRCAWRKEDLLRAGQNLETLDTVKVSLLLQNFDMAMSRNRTSRSHEGQNVAESLAIAVDVKVAFVSGVAKAVLVAQKDFEERGLFEDRPGCCVHGAANIQCDHFFGHLEDDDLAACVTKKMQSRQMFACALADRKSVV
eukprot:TRINITY_DN46460_c0_g1_i1.p2 TRINITY_DN46460_c0_g1~~TRINITY_DN46460_c0_g1_i1.p2  ORF type:complete len:148 (-),score=26.50 TRINITY_DN46460_c0_g1_i1:12-455(-)